MQLKETHTCPKCGITKPIDQFYRDKSKPSGHTSYCRPCHNQVRNKSHARLQAVVHNGKIINQLLDFNEQQLKLIK